MELPVAEESCPTDDGSDYEFEGPPPGMYGPNSKRRHSVCGEALNPNTIAIQYKKVVYPKTKEQIARLKTTFKDVFLLRHLDEESCQEVCDAMREHQVKEGDSVITQGEDGDNFYIVDTGVYEVFVDDQKVGEYDGKGSFGELALMYNTPRAATISASCDGMLWALDRSMFRRILMASALKKRKLYAELLKNVPLLESLSFYEKATLADALQSTSLPNGACIINEGDKGDNFYLIERGQVRVTKKCEGTGEEIEVTRIPADGFFGELALISHKPRAASVYADGPVTLAYVDAETFQRLGLGAALGNINWPGL